MNLLAHRPRTPEAAALRERIFNVLPAASYQMEKLFGLLDIEYSDETETACVECRVTPRLLLNRQFVEEHCREDGDLFLLILHELHHVILGHTRLFPRVTLFLREMSRAAAPSAARLARSVRGRPHGPTYPRKAGDQPPLRARNRRYHLLRHLRTAPADAR